MAKITKQRYRIICNTIKPLNHTVILDDIIDILESWCTENSLLEIRGISKGTIDTIRDAIIDARGKSIDTSFLYTTDQ